jgi:hypothetical protein
MGELCGELGMSCQILDRQVSPNGELHRDGHKVL